MELTPTRKSVILDIIQDEYMDNAIIVDDMNKQKGKLNFLKNLKPKLPKIIFGLLGLILVIEIGILIKTALTPIPPTKKVQARNLIGGKIVLAAKEKGNKVGTIIPLTVGMTSAKSGVSAADVILRYDPKILEASSTSITFGKIFSEYPLLEVDQTSGIIKISGGNAPGTKDFVGTDVFAKVNFKAKAKGTTLITVDFKPGKTTDSNIIKAENSRDILNEVFNASLSIE